MSDKLVDIPTTKRAGKTPTRKATKATIVPKPMGRPSSYKPDLANEICRRIMEGRPLSKVCLDSDMPLRQTVHNWLLVHPEFFDNYTRACTVRREYRFETLEDVVDNEEDPARARIKVDVIKWQLSKEEPKKYGDKLDVTSDGEKVVPILGIIPTQTETKQVEAKNIIDL